MHSPPPPFRPPPQAAQPSPWQRLRFKFLSLFTHQAGGLGGGSSSMALPVARSRSRDEMTQLLLDLHQDLMRQVCVCGGGGRSVSGCKDIVEERGGLGWHEDL